MDGGQLLDAVNPGALLAFDRSVDALPLFGNYAISFWQSKAMRSPGRLDTSPLPALSLSATGRGGRGCGMSRVYAIEATPTFWGAVADHRFVLKPQEMENGAGRCCRCRRRRPGGMA